MLIENAKKKIAKLRRSETLPPHLRVNGISSRSLPRSFMSGFYEHLVPTGLFPVSIAIIICTIGVINLRAHIDPPDPQSAQSQMQMPEGLDYSRFQHSSNNHARLPCLLCHRRESNAPVPKRPGASQHLPCAGCHAQQFANAESPICTICHTDAKSGATKPFPARLISFGMKFDHAKHRAMDSVNCTTCHRPARGGVAMTIPADFNAHTTCFRCHTPRAQSGGRDISSCGTCHQLGGYSRTPQNMPAFRLGFSHARHDPKTSCNDCHQVRAGMPQRRQVTTPEPLNHHASGRGQSCATCHNGKRAFGDEDFSVCTRCHTGTAWRFGSR